MLSCCCCHVDRFRGKQIKQTKCGRGGRSSCNKTFQFECEFEFQFITMTTFAMGYLSFTSPASSSPSSSSATEETATGVETASLES